MNRLYGLCCVVLLMVAAAGPAAAWDAEDEAKAQEAVTEFKKADPKMQVFFDKAFGYAVFNSVGKAGMGVGGAHGSGVVYAQGAAVGTTKLTQLSVGFQLGAQAYREIIFFKDKETFERFTKGNFELSAQASAVAATAGISAETEYDHGVAIFTMAKGGLMYEASVGGQKFSYRPNEQPKAKAEETTKEKKEEKAEGKKE